MKEDYMVFRTLQMLLVLFVAGTLIGCSVAEARMVEVPVILGPCENYIDYCVAGGADCNGICGSNTGWQCNIGFLQGLQILNVVCCDCSPGPSTSVSNQQMATTCQTNADCPANYECKPSGHPRVPKPGRDAAEREPAVPDIIHKTCVPKVPQFQSCGPNNHCPSGYVCYENKCVNFAQ